MKGIQHVKTSMPIVVLFWNRWRKGANGETGQPRFTWKTAVKTEVGELTELWFYVPLDTK